ncbi:MAG: ribonuclease E activity regulator RraA [Deltaproteobacteria bacterium]|nr:ribonuclease E activity regulator RraA [Deltaproteobacteria bacterium]
MITTPQATTDLCDARPDARAAEPLFRDFGGQRAFAGAIATLAVFEDNSLVRTALEEPGQGRVLVVDGRGSLRCALLGGNLAALAEKNGWSGVVVFGAVRDAREIAATKIGVKALAAHPKKSEKRGAGSRDVEVTFAGVTFVPGHHLYADEDGIVVVET